MPVRMRFLAVALALAGAACVQAEGFEVQTGELDGVPYTVAIPEDWNGTLLLQAHGSRPPDTPLLADLDLQDAANRALLDEGWLIAYSAYRRNGPIVGDAALDLIALRDHVVREHGEPRLVLVEGWSMGAAVATLLAERHPDSVDGAFAIGARYASPLAGEDLSFSAFPRVPVLLMNNMGETRDARAYVEAAAKTGAPAVLCIIERYGHVNVNSVERLNALHALAKWVREDEMPDVREATVEMTTESVARRTPGAAAAVVVSVHPAYGNITTRFVPDDLSWLGVAQGGRVSVSAGGKIVDDVIYGKSYASVIRGRWVIFPDAEGRLVIARNADSAVGTLACAAGDTLRLSVPGR